MAKKVTLKIESMAPLGDGVSITDGQIFFVPGALPGDCVDAEVIKKDKRGVFTKMLKITSPSPHRRSAPCEYFSRCGGCSLMHAEESLQREIKMKNLARQFQQKSVDFAPAGPPLGYRRLARLHARKQKNGAVLVGFFGRRAHHIVDVDYCPILDTRISERLPVLKDKLFCYLNAATIRISTGDEGVFISVETDDPLPPAFYETAAHMVPNLVQGIVVEWDGIVTTVAGQDTLTMRTFDHHQVVLPAGSFGQANAHQNSELTQTVYQWIAQGDAHTVVELYAGAGNFSVGFVDKVKRLTLVERDARACAAAEENFKAHPHVRVLCDDALNGYLLAKKNADLVLLDPPRTGAKEVAQAMVNQPHQEIIYVSCNPGTLKRDLGILQNGGYSLLELKGFDMFPQTTHLEAAARLIK